MHVPCLLFLDREKWKNGNSSNRLARGRRPGGPPAAAICCCRDLLPTDRRSAARRLAKRFRDSDSRMKSALGLSFLQAMCVTAVSH